MDNPYRYDPLATAYALLATLLLPIGLLYPALHTTQFAFWSGEHSIIGFGYALFAGQEYALAGIVWLLSIAFPAIKLIWLWRLLAAPQTASAQALRRLEWLGKWSMADVLIIALVVFSARGSAAFDAEPEAGLYAFTASVLLAMFASGRLLRLADTAQRAYED